MWIQFYSAYEFRASFPWLDESGYKGVNGLQTAIENALSFYDIPNPMENDSDWRKDTPQPQGELPEKILTSDEMARLVQAVIEVTQDNENLKTFAYALAWGDIDINTIPYSDLYIIVIKALNQYIQERAYGLSADPL